MRPARFRLAAGAAVLAALVPAVLAAASLTPGGISPDIEVPGDRITQNVRHAPFVSLPRARFQHDPAGILRGAPIHGMILEGPTDSPSLDIPDFPRLKKIGVNTLMIYIYAYADNATSNNVRITLATQSDAELSNLANLAHLNGFAVQFSPIVWIDNPHIWRGDMKPTDKPAFFRSYTAMVTHYAQLAQKLDVELFAIGSEMNSLQGYDTQWRAVASAVNRIYHGLTTYMSTANAGFTLTWWSAVDLISVSPYYSLTNKMNPTETELYTVWMNSIMP